MDKIVSGFKNSFFFKKYASTIAIVVAFLVLCALSSLRADFNPIEAIADLPGGFVWLFQNFMPTLDSLDKLPKIIGALISTFFDAVAAATIAAVIAYLLALVGSRTTGFGGIVELIIRGIATVLRNIPTVAWAFILIFSFRQGEFTGFLVLFLKSFGFLLRSFLETIDEMPHEAVDALSAVGATRLQKISHAVIPLTLTQVVTWTLYTLETNIRDATLVGMLTGAGIGFVFDLYYRTFRYDIAGLVILSIVVMAIICEVVSNFVRRRLIQTPTPPTAKIHSKKSKKIKLRVLSQSDIVLRATLIVLVVFTVYTFFQMDYGGINLLDATRGALNNFGVMVFSPGTDGYWTMGELLNDLLLTICLAVLTTLGGAVIALIIALPAACNLTNKVVSNIAKVILSVIRAIPTIIWVLIFVIAIGLGAEACIVGMMFHTVAFLAKAYSEAFEEIDKGVLEALKATGASWWQIVTHCVLPEKLNEILSWTFIRFENNFVNTVVIAAMCGSGGIGYQLYLAANFYFSMHAVGLITYMCLTVSIILEIIATGLRRHFIVNR